MHQGGQSFSPFIDVVIHHQFGHHCHLFFFFLTHFQTLATLSCLQLRRNYPVARLLSWTARQCTGRVVEAGVDTISSSPFPRLRMWTLSASVLVKRLFFSVRTDSALFRYLPGDEPVLWAGVHVDINCLCSHGDEVLVTPLA